MQSGIMIYNEKRGKTNKGLDFFLLGLSTFRKMLAYMLLSLLINCAPNQQQHSLARRCEPSFQISPTLWVWSQLPKCETSPTTSTEEAVFLLTKDHRVSLHHGQLSSIGGDTRRRGLEKIKIVLENDSSNLDNVKNIHTIKIISKFG